MRNPGPTASGAVDYSRHFGLLSVIIAVVAGISPWRPAMGLMASYAVYGALHAALLSVSVRETKSPWQRPCFVAAGAVLCLLNVAMTEQVARMMGGLGAVGPPVLLTAAAGGGAAAYAVLFGRFFGVRLTPWAVMSIALGCAAATLAVFVSPWRAAWGGFGVAAAWWISLSSGLWWNEERNLS